MNVIIQIQGTFSRCTIRKHNQQCGMDLPPSSSIFVAPFVSPTSHAYFSLHQRLEHRIRRVFVELDADFRPQIVGEIVQLPARCHRHQDRLGLLVDRKFDDSRRVGNQLDGSSEVQCADDHCSATGVPTEQGTAQVNTAPDTAYPLPSSASRSLLQRAGKRTSNSVEIRQKDQPFP